MPVRADLAGLDAIGAWHRRTTAKAKQLIPELVQLIRCDFVFPAAHRQINETRSTRPRRPPFIPQQRSVQFPGRGESADQCGLVGLAFELAQLPLLLEVNPVRINERLEKYIIAGFPAETNRSISSPAPDSATPVLMPAWSTTCLAEDPSWPPADD
jgi:hypothetical protein